MHPNSMGDLTESEPIAPRNSSLGGSFHINPHAVPLSTHKHAVIASSPYGETWVVGQVVGASQVTDNSPLLGVGPPIGHPAARAVGSHPAAHVRRTSKCSPKPPRTGAV